MPTVTAIVTCHDEDPSYILEDLHTQTYTPDEIILIWSVSRDQGLRWDYKHERVMPKQVIKVPNYQDWGHRKRAAGIFIASMDYIGFFNADDKYDPTYLQTMLEATDDGKAGFVYCLWNGQSHIQPARGSSTSGNFLVARPVAIAIGGWKHYAYDADGLFIEDAVTYCKEHDYDVVPVPKDLYTHNPPDRKVS